VFVGTTIRRGLGDQFERVVEHQLCSKCFSPGFESTSMLQLSVLCFPNVHVVWTVVIRCLPCASLAGLSVENLLNGFMAPKMWLIIFAVFTSLAWSL